MLADGLRATRSLTERVRGSSIADPGKSDVLFELAAKENQFEHALADSLGLSLFAVVAPDRDPRARVPSRNPAPRSASRFPARPSACESIC